MLLHSRPRAFFTFRGSESRFKAVGPSPTDDFRFFIVPGRSISSVLAVPPGAGLLSLFLVQQALTEAFDARYCAESASGGGDGATPACACSPAAETSDEPSRRRRIEAAALAEFAAVPFLNNELFVLIRALQRLLTCAPKEEEEGGGGVSTNGRPDDVVAPPGDGDKAGCEDPEACLESVLTSQAFRVLAEQSMDRGLDREAAAFLGEAISQMEASVEEAHHDHRLPRPSRYSRCSITAAHKRKRSSDLH